MVPGSPSKPATCSWCWASGAGRCASSSATGTPRSVVGSTMCSAPRVPRCSSRRSRLRTPTPTRSAGSVPSAPSAWDWLLIISSGHLEQVLRIYVEHYNRHRPHRALGLEAPDRPARLTVVGENEQGEVRRRDLLGGLLHEYRRAA